jgi:hypothetical protein
MTGAGSGFISGSVAQAASKLIAASVPAKVENLRNTEFMFLILLLCDG